MSQKEKKSHIIENKVIVEDELKLKPLYDILDFYALSENTDKIFPVNCATSFLEVSKALSRPEYRVNVASREFNMPISLYNAYNAFITNETILFATRALVAVHFFSMCKGKIIKFSQLEFENKKALAENAKLKVLVENLTKEQTEKVDEHNKVVSLLNLELDTLKSKCDQLSSVSSMLKAEKIELETRLNNIKSVNEYVPINVETIIDIKEKIKLLRIDKEQILKGLKSLKQLMSEVNILKAKEASISFKNSKFIRSAQETYFAKIFKNPRLNSTAIKQCICSEEVDMLREYEPITGIKESDEYFLNLYSKIAKHTSFKSVTYLRNMLAKQYWHLANTDTLTQKEKFYVTYVDPFNTLGKGKLMHFLTNKSKKNRQEFCSNYRDFDMETGSKLTIFNQDVKEQFDEHVTLYRTVNLTETDKNKSEEFLDTNYYGFF